MGYIGDCIDPVAFYCVKLLALNSLEGPVLNVRGVLRRQDLGVASAE